MGSRNKKTPGRTERFPQAVEVGSEQDLEPEPNRDENPATPAKNQSLQEANAANFEERQTRKSKEDPSDTSCTDNPKNKEKDDPKRAPLEVKAGLKPNTESQAHSRLII